MKKIILIIFFFLNISTNITNHNLSVEVGCKVYAQYGTPCTNPGGPGQNTGTSASWWSTLSGWISTIGTWIGQQFSGGGSSSSSSSSPWSVWLGTYGSGYNPNQYNQYTGGGSSGSSNGWPNNNPPFIGITSDGYYMNGTLPPSSPINYNPPTIIFLPTSQCDPVTNPFCLSMVFPNNYDCAGAIISYNNASLDACGRCSGGATGLVPCNLITQSTSDTLKATKVNCDSIDTKRNIRAIKSTQILDAIKDFPFTKNARDSAPFRKFEVGFTITRTQLSPTSNYVYKPENYNKTGRGSMVIVTHNANSVASLHVHNNEDSAGNIVNQSQSVQDYYNVLVRWNNPAYPNHRFDRDYVISGKSDRNEFVAVIADTNLAKRFLLNNPWNTVVSPTTNSWFGDIFDEGTYMHDYYDARRMFTREGYPKNLLDVYANVYMLDKKGLGIKLQQKVNGQFKELNFVEKIDPVTGKKNYTISICQ